MEWKKDGLFGRDNVHRAIWGAFIGSAIFLWGKSYGPQQVVLAEPVLARKNENSTSKDLEKKIDDLPTKQELKELSIAINNLAKVNSTSKSDRSHNQKLVQELSTELDKLRAQVVASEQKANAAKANAAVHQAYTGAIGESALAAKETSKVPAQVDTARSSGIRPALSFAMPSSFKGYTQAKLIGSHAIKCPNEKLQAGQKIDASFVFNDLKRLDRASPLEVSLVRVRAPTNLLRISHQWLPLQVGVNSISINSPALEAGDYQLMFGYYLVDELAGDFPKRYGHICEISVT